MVTTYGRRIEAGPLFARIGPPHPKLPSLARGGSTQPGTFHEIWNCAIAPLQKMSAASSPIVAGHDQGKYLRACRVRLRSGLDVQVLREPTEA